jgi:NAD(P)-dependent dehydrogenase (short-subunit alcohol dehydrogenase family)
MQQTKSSAQLSLKRTLEGQRVVTIGGTSGFGMAAAKAASAEGASVIVASGHPRTSNRTGSGKIESRYNFRAIKRPPPHDLSFG